MPPRKRPATSPPEQNAVLEDAVTDLTGEVRTLTQHVEVLRIAVDDLRQELEFALRNWRRNEWVPVQSTVSVTAGNGAGDHEGHSISSPNVPVQNVTPTTEGTDIALRHHKAPSRKKGRLDLKLYFQTVYADLVRFIGYEGKSLKDVQLFVRDLEAKYGTDKVKEAGDDVAVIEGQSEPYTVHLRGDVRKLAVQMLGPPPEAQVPAEHSA